MKKILTLGAAALALAVSGAAVAGKKTPAGPLSDPGGSITPPAAVADALYTALGGGTPAFFQAVANAPGAVIDPVTGNASITVDVGGESFDITVDQDGNVVGARRRARAAS